MSGGIEIRPMREGDFDAFAALTSERPGYDLERAKARTSVIWHIAFENPTSDGKPTYYVAAKGDRLLCHMGRMPTWFWIKGQRHLASFAHDLFGHPELQATGRGFFVTMKLYKAVETACPSFCGLVWTNEINVKLQQARRYDQMWTKPWVRLMSADRLVSKLALPARIETMAKWFARAGLGVFDRSAALILRKKVERITRFDPRFDDFAARVGPDLGIAPIKDAAYLNWRYPTWPTLKTTSLALADRSGTLRGFVVLRDPDRLSEGGRILDLVFHPDDVAGGLALGAAALQHYADLGVERIESLATAPASQRILRALLFVPRGAELPVFFLNGEKFADRTLLSEIKNWHHTFGDSEGGEVP